MKESFILHPRKVIRWLADFDAQKLTFFSISVDQTISMHVHALNAAGHMVLEENKGLMWYKRSPHPFPGVERVKELSFVNTAQNPVIVRIKAEFR